MKTNAVRFAAGLALVVCGASCPASAQYFPPPLIIVPPPAQEYAAPKPDRQSPPPAKPKPPPDVSPQSKPAGHYQGRTFIPD
jgi:hypothetical protein